jgi:YspA, cpYpsA-related SLOG family
MTDEPRRRTAGIRRTKPDRRYYTQRDPEERRKLPVGKYVHKILVTGDREWSDIPRVVEELRGFRPGTILVHGACRGADVICAAVAEALRFDVRPYPADWVKHKRAAGPIRNQQMLDVENKPEEPIDLCLAFHNNIIDSRGTADMLDRVIKAGVPWKLCTSSDGANSSPPEGGHQPPPAADV